MLTSLENTKKDENNVFVFMRLCISRRIFMHKVNIYTRVFGLCLFLKRFLLLFYTMPRPVLVVFYTKIMKNKKFCKRG